MYRCRICSAVSPPGQPLLKHVALRPDGSILGEVPVCQSCRKRLDGGEPIAQLVARFAKKAPARVAEVKPERLF